MNFTQNNFARWLILREITDTRFNYSSLCHSQHLQLGCLTILIVELCFQVFIFATF